jgi:hypothetical protein
MPEGNHVNYRPSPFVRRREEVLGKGPLTSEGDA